MPCQYLKKNIDMGWLQWVNNSDTTKFLAISPPVLKEDLFKYINKKVKKIFYMQFSYMKIIDNN
jgi:hypothetical protein